MRLLLDTNRYSDLMEQQVEVVERVAVAEAVYLPFVVLAELRDGFRKGRRRDENETKLARFLATTSGVLYADGATIDRWVELSDDLRRRGRPIPVHDMWIAALALQHDLTLYSRDAHFDCLPQLRRL